MRKILGKEKRGKRELEKKEEKKKLRMEKGKKG